MTRNALEALTDILCQHDAKYPSPPDSLILHPTLERPVLSEAGDHPAPPALLDLEVELGLDGSIDLGGIARRFFAGADQCRGTRF